MAIKTYRMAGGALSLFLLITLFSATARAKTITVDDDGPADFNNIQAAIDDSEHGDVIEVQPGTYTGDGNRDIDFLGKAITVRSIDPNDPNIVASTIIDCNGTDTEPHRGFYFNSGEEANSVLAGLTITNGYSYFGSAVCCEASRPTIINCIISGNGIWGAGGAISCRFCSMPWPPPPERATNPDPPDGSIASRTAVLSWTAGSYATSHDVYFGTTNPPLFIRNQTSTTFDPGIMSGGTMYYWLIDEVNINGKTHGYRWDFLTTPGPPAPLAAPQTTTLSEQSSSDVLSDFNLPGPTITNCNFSDNSAHKGGGVYIQNSMPTLNNCIFIENSAGYGGGVYNYSDSNTILQGCTFTNNSSVIRGGGIANITSNLAISNCIFIDNSSIYGGGMYCESGGNARLTNCTFSDNIADSCGGGICSIWDSNTILIDCIFNENSAFSGAGFDNADSKTKLINCIFTDNSASGGGGGLYIIEGIANLDECIFRGNSASHGGGMYNAVAYSTLTNCVFSKNKAEEEGGGMFNEHSSPILTNCLFSGNVAEYTRGPVIIIPTFPPFPPSVYGIGGAMSNEYCSAELINCTFTGNRAKEKGGAIWWKYPGPPKTPPPPAPPTGGVIISDTMTEIPAIMDINDNNVPVISNCIFWDNKDSNGTDEPSQIRMDPNLTPVVINYSCIQGLTGTLGGTGNIDADPCFVQPSFLGVAGFGFLERIWYEGYYQLLKDSPCIDTGDPNYIPEPNETDLDGRPRVAGDRIDMGAYEYQGPGRERLFYVDDDATGANNGSSWDNAFNYLQDAMAEARYGDTIFVAQGTYKPDQADHALVTPGDWYESFRLKNGVAIMGGYAGTGAPDPNARDIGLYETILSGDLDGNDVQIPEPCDPLYVPVPFENSEFVVFGAGNNTTAILDGFIVFGAYASGMVNKNGSPVVTGCSFIGNGVSAYCAGMTNYDSSPHVTNCRFVANYCGMNNSRSSPEYQCSPKVTGCVFSYNSVEGGMFNRKSDPILKSCIFTHNSSYYGGGIYNSFSNPTLTNCLFSRNATPYSGGGLRNYRSNPILTNCTLSDNWAGSYGGGIYNIGSDANLTNCILWGDSAEEGSEIYLVKYIDSQGTEYPSTMDVDYSNIGGWDTNIYVDADCTLSWGGGNIDADPCFVGPGYWDVNGLWLDGDYHLLPDSPCIDSGINSAIPLSVLTDLEGNPRIWDGDNDSVPVVDMGAYEYYEASIVQAEAEIDPHTLNLNSKGRWITAFIWLPEEYNVADIDPNSILLEDQVKPERFWLTEDNQIAEAKFDREQVQAILVVGDIELTITGQLNDGTPFEAKDVIKVIDKGGKK